MPSARKVFSGRTADADPPIEFTMEIENGAGEKKSIDFQAYGDAPADALLLIGKFGRVTPEGKEVVDVHELGEFFEKALLPESAKAWAAMIADKEWMVRGVEIGDVFFWIQEEWADRPTGPSPG